MKPFSVSSSEGGVRAYFMNQYPWYEEYPSKFLLITKNSLMMVFFNQRSRPRLF